MKKLFLLFIALMTFGQIAFAQKPALIASAKPGWHKIGEITADFKTEDESIVIMGNDKFKSIKLKVKEAPINLSRVLVYFEDDIIQEIPVKGIIKAGSETPVYYLQDPTREIK